MFFTKINNKAKPNKPFYQLSTVSFAYLFFCLFVCCWCWKSTTFTSCKVYSFLVHINKIMQTTKDLDSYLAAFFNMYKLTKIRLTWVLNSGSSTCYLRCFSTQYLNTESFSPTHKIKVIIELFRIM